MLWWDGGVANLIVEPSISEILPPPILLILIVPSS